MSDQSTIKFNPDLVDVNESSGGFILLTVFTILIVLSTGTRIATKLCYRLKHGIDDYMIIVALAVNLTANILEYQSINAGFGRHLQFLSSEQASTIKRLSEYTLLLADVSLWAVKISICFFLLSMIQNTYQLTHWVIYGLATLTTIASICQAVFWGLQAQPLEKLWNPEMPGRIANMHTLVVTIIAFTAINSVTDLFYALAPLYLFRRLQIGLKKKLVLYGLTGSGLLVFTASIIRVAYVNDFFAADYSWALHRVYMCTIVERNFAEVIADLPAIFPLLRSLHTKAGGFFSRLSSRATRSGSKSTSKYNTNPSAIPTNMSSGLKADRFGDFGAYGMAMPLNNITVGCSEDEIPLREGPSLRDDQNKYDNGRIRVNTTVDVQSHSFNDSVQERRDQAVV
ncbi:hypothetical protein VP1G_08123 [Cytospora mali]|uniref:Rhodopsin domain-containing protein n=1 Tax=Cytospora mali TaxID=578113 RepID=A0A194VAT4_CYTMA|nr:hypothetical protein VP1G_08123 [Valsa mali var. pyri (nom. inval.)]